VSDCVCQQSSRSEKRLKWLEKIARACGIMPRGFNYSRTFADCTTARQKETKLRDMLHDAGMHGTYTLTH